MILGLILTLMIKVNYVQLPPSLSAVSIKILQACVSSLYLQSYVYNAQCILKKMMNPFNDTIKKDLQ